MALLELSFWFSTVLLAIYLYLKYKVYNYWKVKGVPHEEPVIPIGNVPFSYFKGNLAHGLIIKQSYEKFKRHRFHGAYLLYEPIVIINDPELIRQIIVQHFSNFPDRGLFSNEDNDPLSCRLTRMNGPKWKKLRAKLSPTLASAQMKQMYPQIEEICHELLKVIDKELASDNIIEIKDITVRFTIDCISSIVFGLNCNSLQNPDNEFCQYGKISNDVGKLAVLLTFYVPSLMNWYPYIPKKRKEVQTFFNDLFEKVMTYRKKENIVRKDFLSMLIELINYGEVQGDNDQTLTKPVLEQPDKLSMREAVSHSVKFFAAGQETTSSAICCCLHELAFNQDVQDKLREEIDEAFSSSSGLNYEKIIEMEYLDMVCCETLRKHPGAPILNRICMEEFTMPDSNYRVEKGTKLVVPISGLHMDPDIYPDPEKFDPTRFTPENKAKRHPFAYLPFGEGPRHCIGKRLGILKPKLALCYLLRNYKFTACERTQKQLTYMTNIFAQVPDGDVYLRVEKRNIR